MTENPGEYVRDFYRRQGHAAERETILFWLEQNGIIRKEMFGSNAWVFLDCNTGDVKTFKSLGGAVDG